MPREEVVSAAAAEQTSDDAALISELQRTFTQPGAKVLVSS